MLLSLHDKWQPAQRDFLLGSADHYQGLPPADLKQLRSTLDRAHQAGLKVVIAPLSLPGMRWSQNNQGTLEFEPIRKRLSSEQGSPES